MLFRPFSLRDLTLKNRIVMPPMCMYSANGDGKATDWHVLHYTTRAMGQVGLIIIEATGVVPGGRISDHCLGIWDDSHIEGLRAITDSVHKAGGKIGIQLIHAGRKSEVSNLQPVAPSPLPFSPQSPMPRELKMDEINRVVDSFRDAARRAVIAGFDVVEVHGAHGYLINQFLSPLANKRTDEYGGSAANRARLLGEVVDAVRGVLPPGMPLCVRVSAHDYEAGGNTPEAVAEMLNLVKDRGIDIVHVSSGAVTPTPPRVYPCYQIGFATVIKDLTGLPVIGGGLVTHPREARQIIKTGIDLVFLGRELLRNPYWPLQAARELGEPAQWPRQYERAQ